MDYPYDSPDFEPSFAALLAAIRTRNPTPKPREENLSLAQELRAAPLAAWVHSLATHLWNDDLGKFETTIEKLDDSYDEAHAALGELGLTDVEAVILGMDGGGEEMLILAAEDSDTGYGVYRFAIDGMAYANGKEAIRLGTIAEMVNTLAKDYEVSDDLKAAAAAAG
ncbi:MAG: hypothetical protein AB7K71_32985 [Polyangiaceae bacterium]